MQKLLKKLNKLKVSVALKKEQLDIKAPNGVITKELLAEIKKHKYELLSFLQEHSTQDLSAQITKTELKNHYQLSSSQYRLWLLQAADSDNSAYNMPSAYKITGELNVNIFEKSVNKLVEKHEILRTNFKVEEKTGTPVQFIHSAEHNLFKFEYSDFSNGQSSRIEDKRNKEFNYSFDLENESLIRIILIRTKDEEFQLLFVLHHIISDAWSSNIILEDIISNYKNLLAGKNIKNTPFEIQYKDYSEWQQKQIISNDTSKTYWTNEFKDDIPVLELPTFQPRPPVKTFNGSSKSITLDEYALESFEKLCIANGASLYMGFQALLKILLFRYTGQREIVIGCPISGRELLELQNQLGFYINTLAIYSELNGEDSFLQTLEKIKASTLKAFEHQEYPFDKLIQDINLSFDRSRNPLFDVIFSIDNNPSVNQLTFDDIRIEELLLNENTSKFDLEFLLKNRGKAHELQLTYNTDLFQGSFIEGIISHITALLYSITTSPNLYIKSLEYIQDEEKTKLLDRFNHTTSAYPKGKSFIDLFKEIVKSHPSHIAIKGEDCSITYEELDSLSNLLSFHLQENLEIKQGDCIGVCLERNQWLIISFLAILKANATYIPIDTLYPKERVDFIKNDSNTKVVIDESFISDFKNLNINEDEKLSPKTNNPDLDIAYVIYTSGTTGTPKGVMISHQSLVNLCYWHKNEYDVTETCKTTLYAGISFDASIWEIAPYLLSGATLYPLNDENTRLDIDKLCSYLNENAITHSYLPTAICHDLISGNAELPHTKVLTGGDTLKIKSTPLFKLFNNYGPTENTVVATSYLVEEKDLSEPSISIGSPISNTRIYILDDNLKLLPIGVSGKLYISGDGLAKGYLNRPELTKEKFLDNPFENGQRMYDTGDMAKWLPDGNITFLGRKDHQVKLRGYRIELGEIENSILAYSEDIIQAVVLVNNETLVAYYSEKGSTDKNAIKEHLGSRLPSYMIPSHYEVLESIPLTRNGKVDRKKLESLSLDRISTSNYLAPRNTTEQRLAEIWQEVLGIEKIGIHDNFFDLGGHSLMVVQVINQIYKALNGKITYRDFFQNPSIEYITKAIKSENYASIPKAKNQEYYPLAPSQLRIWILSQIDSGSATYNMQGTVMLDGILDIDKFNRAIDLLIDRHEILRTAFRVDQDGEVRQYIVDNSELNFGVSFFDFKGQSTVEINKYLHEKQQTPFDLTKAPLLKASLLQTKDNVHIFSFVIHHIIGDGWSMEVMISEVIDTYNQLLKNDKFENEALALQYKDYAVWMHSQLQDEVYKAAESYWLDKFQGELPVLDLPSLKKRPVIQTYNGKTINQQFSKSFLAKLKQYSQEQDATLFMTLMTGINALLHRYTNQKDIIIGTPIAGREHPDLENQIGLYLNTLAIRTQIDSESSLEELLQQQKQNLLEAYQHQRYPFNELVNKLNISRDTSRSALFDVMVVLQNQSQLQSINSDQGLDGIMVDEYQMENIYSKFDMNFTFVEGEGLDLSIEFNTDIYDDFLIERIFIHFENLMNQVIDNPKLPISSLAYITQKEQNQLLLEFNDNKVDSPKDKTIIDLFEAQVEKTPKNVAVIFNGKETTYLQINEKANQLAGYLKSNFDIRPNDLIALKLGRSENLVIAILGILKSGAAYVPVDTDYPQQRIEHIEKDSKAKIVLDQSFFEAFEIDRNTYTKENISSKISSENLAYVIYTSGTTGRPKGVAISHGNAVELLNWAKQEFNPDSFNIVYAATSHCFDLSIYEMFFPLVIGKKIRLLNSAIEIGQCLANDTKVLINTVPSNMRSILDSGISLENTSAINLAGEPFPIDIGNRLAKSKAEVRNLYGPSEDTTYSTVYELDKSIKYTTSIPVGKPISNTSIYILDKNLNLLPIGVSGRLYISGAGLADGYLNRPELTKEKFIDNPFEKGQRMYDTGDMAKWLLDGNIAFLGREDHQVKLRGYRIELGEIESSILAFSEDINQAVVMVKNETLVAYYSEKSINDKNAIKEHLRTSLPSYMIPSHFEVLESIPLTPNGKVDRKKLERLDLQRSSTSKYLAPRNATEQRLAEIWQEVLGIEKVGIQDNFFELGGHSLMIVQVINQIYKQLNGNVTYYDFFLNPVIEHIANTIKSERFISIPKAENQEYYPLIPSQLRIWVLSQLDGGSTAYNMPETLVLTGNLNIEKFKRAFDLLIERHEILRTSFISNLDGEILQYIAERNELNFDIELLDFTGESKDDIDKYLRQEQQSPFDLTKAPLLSASLLKTKEDTHIFSFVIHHIIGDGWSMELMITEVISTYNELLQNDNFQSKALSLQYKDYSLWLQSQLSGEAYKTSETYWLNKFRGELPVLDLPSYKKRPLIQTYNGKTIHHQFSKSFLSKLKQFSQEQDVTLFMTLMAGINALLHHYTNQNDIIIGTPIAGREHPDLENQIGLYLNTLAIRTHVESDLIIEDLLLQQKQTLLEAYQHQNYPFDDLVNKLDLKRDTSRSVLFDVMVILQNQAQIRTIKSSNNLIGLQVNNYELNQYTSKFDLSFTFVEDSGLALSIEYNTDIYDDQLVERIFTHFKNLLNQAIDDPTRSISSIEYITKAERDEVILSFNSATKAYPKDKTIVDLFEEQVKKTPNNIAVEFDEKQLTYQELNEQANQFARHLIETYNVKPGDLVGIKLERNLQLLTTILGVLKSGSAYVPIDINYPEERKNYIEEDSNSKVVVDDEILNTYHAIRDSYSSTNLDKVVSPDHIAYVIYTSGTTGKPKGVMIMHSNAVAMLNWANDEFDSAKFEVAYAATSHCFDLSIFEMFYPLTTGKKVKLFENALVIGEALRHDEKVLINTVPSSMRNLLETENSLENAVYINLAGEPFPLDIAQSLLTTTAEIRNLYGPSEDTTYSTSYKLSADTKYEISIPIGKPISNSQAYILRDNLDPVPIGVAGNLYVAGAGVSKGYLNREELTSERFISNPFKKDDLMYATGDLAMWMPDGNIKFIGRKDSQVKLRGYRIELEEIENTILKYSDDIEQAILNVIQTAKGQDLVAYYVCKSEVKKSELKAFLQETLPSYMVPSYYKELKSVPLTPNGKIDKRSLPAITSEALIRNTYVAPRNELEKQLVAIWQKVLNIEKIGVTDNFFELGGHSLLAIVLVNQINKEFDNITLKINNLFSSNTIESVAQIISVLDTNDLDESYDEVVI